MICLLPIKRSNNQCGYTLYLVLLLLTIAAVLFTVSIAEIRSVTIFAKKEQQKCGARLLACSGSARAEYFLNGGDGHALTWETDGFEEKLADFGTIHLVAKRLGLFTQVYATGTRVVTTCTVAGLYGRDVPAILTPTLSLTGRIGSLVVQEGSSIEGRVVIHHGEVKASKKGSALPSFRGRVTCGELPSLPFDSMLVPELLARCRTDFSLLLKQPHALTGDLYLQSSSDSLTQLRELVVHGDCRIAAPCRQGITIAATGTVTLLAGAQLDGAVCSAKRILCESGCTEQSLFFSEETMVISAGNHNSQFVGNDSLLVNAGASFGKMNLLLSYRQKNGNDSAAVPGGGIFCAEGVVIHGTLISAADPQLGNRAYGSSIVVGKGSTIYGTIITDGDLALAASDVFGHIWANAIVAKDSDGSYTNFLIATRLRKEQGLLCFPLVGEPPARIVAARLRVVY